MFGSGVPPDTKIFGITLSEVQEAANKYRDQIIRDSIRLTEVLQRYEYLIQRRWRNKSREQRKAFLRRVDLELPEFHRQEFDFLRKYLLYTAVWRCWRDLLSH